MKESKFNTGIHLKSGRYLIHNSRCNSLAILDPEEVKELENGNEELMRQGFFVPDDFDELQSIHERFTYISNEDRYMTLSIMPTLACNFRCDYCYEGQEHCGGFMSEATCQAICEFVKSQIYRLNELHVCWYGGEPLLGIHIIERLSKEFIQICDEAHIKYGSSMVSNGYYLTEKNAQILQDAHVQTIQITIDGEKDYHDQRRILSNGEGTFDVIVKNIQNILKRDYFTISVRVNIDTRNKDGILKMFEQLHEAGLSRNPHFRIYFAQIIASTQACASISCDVLPDEQYSRVEVELIRQAINHGFAFPPYPKYMSSACAAVKPLGFVVLPDGNVHKCWHTVPNPEESIGTIEELAKGMDLKENPIYQKWIGFSPIDREECISCKVLSLCAGGCAHKHLVSKQSPCLSMKYNLKSKILMYAIVAGFVSVDEIPDVFA